MKKRICILLLAVSLLLCGCNAPTIDQLYSLPKRSKAYDDLQAVIDSTMVGYPYCAPISGENQQTVQLADLDGDGEDEYLLFAKANDDNALRIFIFKHTQQAYSLMTQIECRGTDFEQVEYTDLDGIVGNEIVVGCRVSDEIMGALAVYRFGNGEAEQIMRSSYSKFLTCDLDNDQTGELLILAEGDADSEKGTARLYNFPNGESQPSREVALSEAAASIKRIMPGFLHGGTPAVYVASSKDGMTLVTDVFAVKDGTFTNISFSNESGTSVGTIRNYYVYADDIDDDGILELPGLISMHTDERLHFSEQQYIIRWFSLDLDASEIDKLYTFHNFTQGWYLCLSDEIALHMLVDRMGEKTTFLVWDEEKNEAVEVFHIDVLTGENREEQAAQNNHFILHRGDSVIYAAKLEATSAAYGFSEQNLVNAFHLIRQDWNTGET